jgi:threonine dehydrogenase-like Zn-dependent dehydrogenase
MLAVTWHGKRDVRVDTVDDPVITDPTDVIIRITSTGICGSDLHLYEVLGPYLDVGDILGHEPMGIVVEVGPEVTAVQPGDRVVVPFNVSCGTCFMCGQGLQSQCETTQVREQGMGAALFGYTKLYGQVPGGQAEYLRVPFATRCPSWCRRGRRTTGSCTCPTCCRPRGRPWSTRPCPRTAAWWCSASDRSATCAPGSRCTAAPAR